MAHRSFDALFHRCKEENVMWQEVVILDTPHLAHWSSDFCSSRDGLGKTDGGRCRNPNGDLFTAGEVVLWFLFCGVLSRFRRLSCGGVVFTSLALDVFSE